MIAGIAAGNGEAREMINRKTRRNKILLVGILAVILFAVSTKKTQGVEKHIIKPDEIRYMQISNEPENVLKELDSEAEIKQLADILNRAVYAEDMNDGRMFKMRAAEYTIKIVYRDDSRISIQIWDDLMRIDQIWYCLDLLDRKQLKKFLG